LIETKFTAVIFYNIGSRAMPAWPTTTRLPATTTATRRRPTTTTASFASSTSVTGFGLNFNEKLKLDNFTSSVFEDSKNALDRLNDQVLML
jgi:hypothetical protein